MGELLSLTPLDLLSGKFLLAVAPDFADAPLFFFVFASGFAGSDMVMPVTG